MKRTSTLLAGLIAVALIATPVFAETASVNVKNKIEDRNKKTEASTTIKVEQKKTEDKNKQSEWNTRVLDNKIRGDIKVFTATANRLDKIVVRIQSRVTKIKAAGGNTTQIEASLNIGKTKLAEARADISTISSIDITGATSSTTVRTLFNTIKTNAVKAREALKASHSALIQAVTFMQGVEKKVKVKDSNVGENETSSSTASTTKEDNS